MTTQIVERPLLKVEKIVKHFPIKRGVLIQRQVGSVHAVDGVSLDVRRGETFGLVGESGCGKSTTGRVILQLYRPDAGEIWFEDVNLTRIKGERLRRMRRKIQMVFQDPYASLNPRMTVSEIISEPLKNFNLVRGKALSDRIENLLNLVGLDPGFANRYPHEFSGGQRQRIGIARALALQPSLIICDEPISALDVSIQAQIANLLDDLQQEFNLSYIFIAHDLSMVRHMSHRIAVMYLGVIVEMADRDALYVSPRHPYTQALLSAVPIPDPKTEHKRARIILQGDVPSPVNPPSGCRFRTRCSLSKDICASQRPELREIAPGHRVACHLI